MRMIIIMIEMKISEVAQQNMPSSSYRSKTFTPTTVVGTKSQTIQSKTLKDIPSAPRGFPWAPEGVPLAPKGSHGC